MRESQLKMQTLAFGIIVYYNLIVMSQSISVSKSVFDELVDRISRLEKAVFKSSDDRVLHSVKQYEEEKKQGNLTKLKNVNQLFS